MLIPVLPDCCMGLLTVNACKAYIYESIHRADLLYFDKETEWVDENETKL